MTGSRVSIIIPCFNAEKYISQAIRSALEQTYPNVEIIVLDDGSTDGSAQVIRSFGNKVRYEFLPHKGASAARNRGVALAAGNLIQFLDADDLLYPKKIERNLEWIETRPDSMVFCNGIKRFLDGTSAHRFPDILDTTDPVIFMLRHRVPILAPLHRREHILAAGGFRENLPCGQDFQFHLKLACAGLHFHYIPELLYEVQRVPGSVSENDIKVLTRYTDIIWPAFRQLAAAGMLSDDRARNFAQAMAQYGRRLLRQRMRAEALDYFRLARRMHPSGGLDIYRWHTRTLHRLLGPLPTERLAGLVGRAHRSSPAPSCTKPEIVFLIHREGLSPVVESVAATPLGMLHRHGYMIKLLFSNPLGFFIRTDSRRRWEAAQDAIRDRFPGPVDSVLSSHSRLQWAWNDARGIQRWLSANLRQQSPWILHCRGPYATRIGLKLRTSSRIKVIQQIPGLAFAEQQSETSEEIHGTREMEKQLAQETDALISVSEAMSAYLIREFGISPEKITLIPNSVDIQRYAESQNRREPMRQRLNVEDRFVVVFCGGVRWWQLADQGIEIFKAVQQLIPRAYYLGLVTDVEKMQSLMARAGVAKKDFTLLRIGHGDVPDYLAAADISLMTRIESVASRISSPVKFPEYLASGLPVLIHPGIGDYSDLVHRESLGVVIPHELTGRDTESRLESFLSPYQRDSEPVRHSCRKIAREKYSWDVHVPKLAALYDRLSVD